MSEIAIESHVPQSHPKRRAIEGVLRDSLRDFAGAWSVLLRPAQRDPWWVVVIQRQRDDFRRTLLLDPREQTPEEVGKSILEALKEAV